MRTLKKEIWPYQAFVKMPTSNNVNELIALDSWCVESIGKRFIDWYSYNLENNTRLYAFKDEATLLVFKIKWGHYGNW